jgi:hypothetical protein
MPARYIINTISIFMFQRLKVFLDGIVKDKELGGKQHENTLLKY